VLQVDSELCFSFTPMILMFCCLCFLCV